MGALQIEILDRRHVLNAFDCGEEQLNKFLSSFALTAGRSGQSLTYAGLAELSFTGLRTYRGRCAGSPALGHSIKD
jgi:hypothetical protein